VAGIKRSRLNLAPFTVIASVASASIPLTQAARESKMTDGSTNADIPFITLVPFLIIAFGLAWGILALFIFLPDQMTSIFGQLTGQHPLFFLAVYAPAIAAFIVITYSTGRGGLQRYLSRLLLWRCSLAWYGFLIVGIPLLYFGGSALKGNLFSEPFPFSSLQSIIVASALMAIKGPVEEFGWRGVALPLLQRKFSPIWAGLILGVIWGFWHLPAFLLSGTPQSAWTFTPFFAGSVAVSVIVTRRVSMRMRHRIEQIKLQYFLSKAD
jgi:membrane protease YdiL (CAAX protease family)